MSTWWRRSGNSRHVQCRLGIVGVVLLMYLAADAGATGDEPNAGRAAAPAAAGSTPGAERYFSSGPTSQAVQLPSDSMQEEPLDPFIDALTGGKAYLKMRFRYETVDQDGFAKRANAFTVRTVVGYETQEYEGFTGLVEFENVSDVGGEGYNDTINGKNRPVIADPTGTEVNQALLRRNITDWSSFKAGRQRIILDNARFVGNVGWRQNEQTFDAVVLQADPEDTVDLFYGYLGNANRIVGEDSPGGDARMDTHLVNAAVQTGDAGRLVGYWYYLDYTQTRNEAQSTSTVGLRFTGDQPLEEETRVIYGAELAYQEDVADNPNSISARYYSAEVGLGSGPVTVKVGREELEGSSADPADAFQTPLATLHAFNGWADKFLVTPGTGLEDTWVSLEGKLDDSNKIQAVLHEFDAESGGNHYGRELDLLYTNKVSERVSWGAKFAYYDADDFATDTEKFWLWLQIQS